MQSKFREFLIHEVKSICRKFSRKAEASTSTDSFERINLSPDVLPSRELFGRLTNTKNRGFSYLEKLACIVAEIEFLYGISSEVPIRLSDDHWMSLLETNTVKEREYFLRSLHYCELTAEKTNQYNLERYESYKEGDQQRKELFSQEFMVYDKNFHTFLKDGFVGQELRSRIDAYYGMRFCHSLILDEPLPKFMINLLRIDCRYLNKITPNSISVATKLIQHLYDNNWSSRHPFEVIIENFFSNELISAAIKRHWHFLFGPQFVYASKEQLYQVMEKLIDSDEQLEQPTNNTDLSADVTGGFEPHPFCPRVSTWSVQQLLKEVNKDKIAYISSKATRYLDGPLSNFEAFVIPASRDSDQSKSYYGSLASSVEDDVHTYRLPIEKYLRNGKLDSTHLTSLDISNIIRDVYYDQMNWEEAIRKHLHSCRYRDLSDTAGQTSDSLVRKQLTKTETPAAAAKLVALLRNERQRRNFVLAKMSSLLCDANTFFELNKGRMEKTSAEHNIEHRYDRDERQRRKEAESAINPEQKVTVKVPSFMKNI